MCGDRAEQLEEIEEGGGEGRKRRRETNTHTDTKHQEEKG
jgi:hypothetical protein